MSAVLAGVTRQEWVATLLRCEGARYVHQGRDPATGLDCVGPLIWAARALGLKPASFDINGYAPQPDGSLQPLLDEHLERVSRDALGLGDVVLNGFRLGPPRHIAVIVGAAWGQWLMLHASSDTGRVQRERLQYERRYYRYVQAYRVPGVVP